VAALDGNGEFPKLNVASVAAFAAIDEELCLAREDQYVPPFPKDRIIVLFRCGEM
jgi:hypothetical protein